ncbi:uncharacterized protein [Coffea arabica]|uniref:Helitron helicase-like domain-containing protein n=1 Tax=Coffea arabica TaxID=13443 RepID=A0A6P6UDY1_COFAR|nr:uncharacterized protein LOC113710091 [Coffea arabica]
MPPTKKAEFLHFLREARAAKKKHSLFLSRVQKISVESSVCVSYSHDKPSNSHDQARVLSNALENGEYLVPIDSVITDSPQLPCISSAVPNFFDDHASSSSRKKTTSSDALSLNKGRKRRRGQLNLSIVNNIPNGSLVLPDASPCDHCGAKRFHLEPPTFCCSGGEISLVAPPMPYDLKRLFIEHVRCNTFRVQGHVYHFLNGLLQSDNRASRIQLYFFDTNEELAKRIVASDKLRGSTLRLLMRILSDNPYAKFFRNLRHVPNINNLSIVNCYPTLDQRVYNLPSASQVVAIWTENQDESGHTGAHIQVYTHSNSSYKIKHYYGCYDPLQYPILFPRGECGWHPGIKRAQKRKRKDDSCEEDIDIHPSSVNSASTLMEREQRAADHAKNEEDTVSAREYYCYKFQMRDSDDSMLLHSLGLLQQYAVDGYVKIETSRLDFHRNRQNNIRSEVLQGVLESICIGQTGASKVGRRTILPASFIGGPRDMRRRYLDAMSLVQKYGKPDIFLTMTCNPAWKEIQDNLKDHEKPQDRPDLLARVFRAKFELLKSEILNKQIFGEVAAYVYVIEFQKRGFPHAHLLLILKPEYKLLNLESYDRVVCAEIPDRSKHPHLYSLVVKHMIHGPYGDLDRTCPCMKDGYCKYHYPKSFCAQTTHAEDSYPQYRRRDDEICSTVKLVKYMYKNVFKGHDSVSFRIVSYHTPDDTDEIREFQQGRWISPLEAFWCIFEFRLSEISPAVYTLQIHLPEQQTNVVAQNLKCLYREFPQYFVWSPKYKKWTERKRRKVIGRMVTVSPADGERYYLRLLLNHVHGPTSFDDILTVANQKLNSFREAALALGLLQSDTYIEDTLQEAVTFQMPSSLRLLFATLLVHCSPVNPQLLWEKFHHELSADYQ